MRKPKRMYKFRILAADNYEGDFNMIYHAIRELNSEFLIERVNNKDQLLSCLNSADENNFPDLILLDINMPKKDAIKALKILKQEPRFSELPVVMYIPANKLRIAAECFKLGANAFVTKDDSVDKTQALVKAISLYLKTTTDTPYSPFTFNPKTEPLNHQRA